MSHVFIIIFCITLPQDRQTPYTLSVVLLHIWARKTSHQHHTCYSCVTSILLRPEWSLFIGVCAGSMDVDVEGIIHCIKQGDENGVQIQLQEFNREVAAHIKSHIIGPCIPVFTTFPLPAVCPVLLLRCRGEGATQSELCCCNPRHFNVTSCPLLFFRLLPYALYTSISSTRPHPHLKVYLWLVILLYQLSLILSPYMLRQIESRQRECIIVLVTVWLVRIK